MCVNHAYEMAHGRCTPMRDKPMRWPMGDARLWEMHAYERHASARHAYEISRVRGTPMNGLWDGLWEIPAYGRCPPMRCTPVRCNAYEMAYGRYTPVRYTPVRGTPLRWP